MSEREAIAAALSEYRCQFTTCDEDGIDGLPLVDKLTPPSQTSIDLGLKEINALADAVYDALPSNGRKPVAWRVRGYSKFKTGTPGPWRYFDGEDQPKVNSPQDCDIEPLFA